MGSYKPMNVRCFLVQRSFFVLDKSCGFKIKEQTLFFVGLVNGQIDDAYFKSMYFDPPPNSLFFNYNKN